MKRLADLRSRRIFPLIPQAFGAAATGLGLTALFGWLFRFPLLASFGADLVPMAPSTALLFVLLGLSIFFRSRFPLNRGVVLVGIALGSLSAAIALLLFYLSSAYIYSSIELLGLPITGRLDGVPIGHMSPVTALLCALIALSFLGTLSSSPEWRGRAVAAFVLACILTLMSTALVITYLLGTPLMYGGAFIPPTFPSSLCSLFLALALLTIAGLQVWPSSLTDETGPSRPLRASLLIFVLLSSGILVIGYVYHRHFEKQYRAEIQNTLASISESKVSELRHWREERLGNANVFYGSLTFSDLVERSLGTPEAVDARTAILTWFRQEREAYQYDRLSLYDTALVERLSYPSGSELTDSLFLRHAAVALRSHEIMFQDFYRDEHTHRVYLNILIPILEFRVPSQVIGMVAMRIDPKKYVYPLLKRWPTPSRTAETVLMRREGETALFLNELKSNNDAALKVRVPLDSTDVPALKAAFGEVGIAEGRDYRGVPVVADILAVPGSPWYLIARVDQSEVYTPLNERLWTIVFLICAMLIGVGSGVGLVSKQQKARFYKNRYLADRESAWLHDVIARSLNEIYVIDPGTLQFKFANSGAQRNIGYTTKELAGLTALDIKPEYTEQSFRASVQSLLTGGNKVLVSETVHRRKDGTLYPVESHLQLVERPEGAVFLAIVNDITERKLSEEAVQESEERFRMVFEHAFDGISIYSEDPDPLKRRLVECNDRYAAMAGRSREELLKIGTTKGLQVTDEDKANNRRLDSLTKGTAYEGSFSWIRPDRKDNVVEYVAIPITWRGKAYSIGIDRDITERRKAEETQLLLNTALESTANGVVISDLKGNIVWLNKAFTGMTGYTWTEVLGQNLRILKSGKQDDSFYRDLWETILAGNVWHGELINKKKDGSLYNEDLTITPLKGGNSEIIRFIAIKQDITERKRAESALRESQEVIVGILDAMPLRVFWKDMNLVYLGCNAAFAADAGFVNPTEIIGKDDYQLAWSDQAERYREDDRLVAESGSPRLLIEEPQTTPQGTTITLLTSKIPLRDSTGTVRGVLGTYMDITARKQAEEAQIESARRFHELFDQAPVGYHECDFQGRIVEVNRTELELLGYKVEEMLGHHTWEFIVESESSREAFAAKIAGSIQSDLPYERTFRRKVGTTINVLLTDRTLRNEAGKVVGIRTTVQDITERKNAEREFRLMAQTVASAPDCISITDLENRFLFVNDAFRKAYGFTTEELVGKDVSIVRSPNTPRATTDPILDSTLDEGWHGEILNRRKDGRDFPVELWTSPVKDEAGIPVAMVGVARDISTRKAAEENLRQSEEQFRLIAENVADMIGVVDLDGIRIYNSPAYRNILGDPESLRGTNGFQEIHPDDVAMVKKVFDETVRTGIGQRIEYRFLAKDGTVRNIDSKGSVIRDREGKISQIILVSRDVTEEKKLAAQFLRAQRMESIGTLAGGIAHDLNNVLAPIMMAIDVLREKMSDPGGQNILNIIEVSAKRGADIVKQVLSFGRGVKGERILLQLKHVVNDLVKIFSQTFPKSIEIKSDIPRDLWTVNADPTQMHQVLLNILVNARDAMPRGGTVTISARNVRLDEQYSRMHTEAKPGAYVCIAITDTGTGIPAELREKIFEPFFTTKEIGAGTGLGLSTTIAIVKGHEGFINLDSEMGKGTTFSIYIPATGTLSSEDAVSEEAALPMGNGELILIIDDEAAIREITKETLQANGYRAATSSNGADGVAVFAENKKEISAVITDIMMPIMDGTAAILALKRIDPNVKIIAASGMTAKGQITPPTDPNVQAFLTKPYTAEKLLKTLAEALR